ncbi:MAG: 30S ribosomal protein S7 [Actinobacteria bacterium]|nr:MAG: 30S ribosomal protein S7 [Actinomycetota bacterium]
MPRRARAEIRKINPDPIYNDRLVEQFVNKVLNSGKKATARDIVYSALDIIKSKTNSDPIDVLNKAVKNVKPVLEVKPRRVGGATYQVPVEVPKRRAMTLAVRWIVDFSRGRPQKTMANCLAQELIDASNNTGASVKKREDIHKMAESNRAFAHYRW